MTHPATNPPGGGPAPSGPPARHTTRNPPRRTRLALIAVLATAAAVASTLISVHMASAAVGAPLVSAASGRCLDVTGNTSTNGTQVQIWDCNGQQNQGWAFTAAGRAAHLQREQVPRRARRRQHRRHHPGDLGLQRRRQPAFRPQHRRQHPLHPVRAVPGRDQQRHRQRHPRGAVELQRPGQPALERRHRQRHGTSSAAAVGLLGGPGRPGGDPPGPQPAVLPVQPVRQPHPVRPAGVHLGQRPGLRDELHPLQHRQVPGRPRPGHGRLARLRRPGPGLVERRRHPDGRLPHGLAGPGQRRLRRLADARQHQRRADRRAPPTTPGSPGAWTPSPPSSRSCRTAAARCCCAPGTRPAAPGSGGAWRAAPSTSGCGSSRSTT